MTLITRITITATFGDGRVDVAPSHFELEPAVAEWKRALPDHNIVRGKRMLTGAPYVAFVHPRDDEGSDAQFEINSNHLWKVVREEVQS